jgi:AraC-like DNA-binding protein
MDPLSGVLSLLKPRSFMFGGFEAGGAWSIAFPRHEGFKCYAIGRGRCWLALDGEEPVLLQTGDCFLLTRGRPFRMTSDLALPPADWRTIITRPPNGGIARINQGADFTSIGGHFTLDGSHAGVLLGDLPAIVHLRSEADRAALRWSIERLRHELTDPQPGGFLVAEHLIHMMLVQVLRLHLAEGRRAGIGWLFALADRQMSAAITAIHDDPAHRWTVQQLAARAGMSRSVFAARFKETVGAAPMDYLTRWRMLLAADRLKNSREPVSAIALSLGYESESAFSTAFKRVMGCAPRQYGRLRAAA